MKLYKAIIVSVVVAATGCSGLKTLGVGDVVSIGSDAYKAASLSDKEVASMASQYAKYSDSTSQVASSGNKYSVRLAKLTKGLNKEDGLNLNFKVYVDPEVNAFALADGTIRVNSGLMDMMTDDEVRAVIGHEIGHVKHGHSKEKMRMAYIARAGRKAVAYQANTAGVLASGELGALGEELLNKQFSQSEESEADAYSVQFMKKHKFNVSAGPSAMRKFATLGGNSGILSSHPDPEDRAEAMEELIAKGK